MKNLFFQGTATSGTMDESETMREIIASPTTIQFRPQSCIWEGKLLIFERLYSESKQIWKSLGSLSNCKVIGKNMFLV